jgi:hypothetical protein
MDESLRVFEDYEFHLRLTRISRAAFVDVPTIFYRCEAEDRLTADRDARRLASQQEQLLRLFERLAEQDPDFRRRNPPWERWFRGRGHSQIARLLALDERQMARRHWREALRYSPLGALTPSLLARLFLPGRIASWLRDLRHGRRVRPAVEAV